MRTKSGTMPILQISFWGFVFGVVGIGVGWIFFGAGMSGIFASTLAVALTLVGFAIGSMGLLNRFESVDKEASVARHKALHDPLTQLLNRAGLMAELESSMTDARDNEMVLGVLFLDLNRFKVINDTMGHDVGDQLLKIVAEKLLSSVRSTDVVARFGGDEFIVLSRGLLSGESVISVANSILKSFAESVTLGGRSYTASTSIGIAIYDQGDLRSSKDLVRDADAAMFKAKREKTGYAVFDETQHQLSVARLEVERDLTSALEENQFVVHYQPIVDIMGEQLYAFEALVRWRHPQEGMIAPGQFLDVANEAGMLGKISDIVLREACTQAALWNHISAGASSVKMSINLSESQLVDPNLQYHIMEVLSWARLEPSQLILEITEDIIIGQGDHMAKLRRLNELGINLAIDDFGTGQSSLNSIKELDMVSTLKIAEKFITDINSSDADRAIIEAIVTMAKALDLNIVAEGIETEEQVRALLNLGVYNMQGYFFARPAPANSMDPERWFNVDEVSSGRYE